MDLIRNNIDSYKKLPLSLFQIQTKYRDEKSSRYGLLRDENGRRSDAYTFHENYEGLDQAYDEMKDAYHKIFDRIGLDYRAVIGDAGGNGRTWIPWRVYGSVRWWRYCRLFWTAFLCC